MEKTRASVHALRRLLDPGGDPLEVEVWEVGELIVAAITDTVDRHAVLDWYAAAMTELDGAVDILGRRPGGPPGALIDHAMFTADRGSLTVFVPITDPPITGRVTQMTVPASTLAVTTHRGDHSDIDVTYGRLATWVVEQGFAVGGRVCETYVVGPRDTPNPGQWRTEIGWPVAR